MDKTSQAISFVAGFAIAGGLIVLASSVAGTRSRRMREVAIFRTVGATKAALVRIFTVEFVAIGLVAGLLGSLLATVLSSVLVAQLLEADYHFRWVPALVATGDYRVFDRARGLDGELRRAAEEAAGDSEGNGVRDEDTWKSAIGPVLPGGVDATSREIREASFDERTWGSRSQNCLELSQPRLRRFGCFALLLLRDLAGGRDPAFGHPSTFVQSPSYPTSRAKPCTMPAVSASTAAPA